MLTKLNHDTGLYYEVRRPQQDLFLRQTPSPLEPIKKRTETVLQSGLDEWESHRAESSRIMGLTLLLILSGIMPLILFLLALLLDPDLLHIQITP